MIGIDEVGRGCWAGPLLVVALRPTGQLPAGLDDSKLLSKPKREALTVLLADVADIGEGWVSPSEIDSQGLTQAMKLGVDRALRAIDVLDSEEIIMDGNFNYCHERFTNVACIVGADGSRPEVSAASVWAKVQRDNYMTRASKQYPEYGFDSHVGYGTARHIGALQAHGVTPLHRVSFKPVRKIYDAR